MVLRLVIDGVSSRHSKRAYSQALTSFLSWCGRSGAQGLTKSTVQAYKANLEAGGLAPSTINLAISAVRKLALSTCFFLGPQIG